MLILLALLSTFRPFDPFGLFENWAFCSFSLLFHSAFRSPKIITERNGSLTHNIRLLAIKIECHVYGVLERKNNFYLLKKDSYKSIRVYRYLLCLWSIDTLMATYISPPSSSNWRYFMHCMHYKLNQVLRFAESSIQIKWVMTALLSLMGTLS